MTAPQITRRGIVVVAFVAMSLVFASSAIAQTLSVSDFANWSSPDKLQLFSRLATHDAMLSAGDLRSVLTLSFSDENPDIRRAALLAIVGRAVGGRLSNRDDVRQHWQAERQLLLTFRPDLIHLFRDPDERVRAEAMLALIDLDYELGQTGRMALKSDAVQELTALYESESSVGVREVIVSSFSSTPTRSVLVERVLMSALEHETAANILQDAMRGVAALQILDTLPRIVALLKDSRVSVRLTAAQTIATFGMNAAAYLPQIQDALGTERDAVVQKTLAGSVRVIERGDHSP